MKVEISERRLIKTMGLYFKANRKYPEDMQEALALGDIYKDAGLNPFYVYDQIAGKFIVTSKENIAKKGH